MKNTELVLPSYISDGMIVQQNKPIIISGKDKAHTSLTVTFDSETLQTEANKEGHWSVTFSEKEAGGPYTLEITGSSHIVIEDVLVGEVWLIGGQSNMELPINRTYDEFKEEIDSADYPSIRQFHLEMDPVFNEPKEFLKQGKWEEATQENIQAFSSLGFFYAKQLYETLAIPIGIIHTAVGGTPIESWISEESLHSLTTYSEEMAYWKNPETVKQEVEKDLETNQTWYEDVNTNDSGLREEPKWYSPEVETEDWSPIDIPVMFKDTELKDFSGVIWLRKTFEVKEEDLQSEKFRLRLGSLINGDETYLNGVKVGETGYRYPPRKYPIKREYLKVGKNTLVIRLTIDANNGGIIPTFPYQVEFDTHSISLEGKWLYKIGYRKEPIDPMLFLHYIPASLFKGMLNPLKDISIRGFLFYQGESNAKDPIGYKDLMKMMVDDWRKLFGEDLPFYYVQLANYLDPSVGVDDYKWAILRDEQDRARLEIKNAEMVPAFDCGLSYELHPYNKKTIAQRLAAVAFNREYRLDEAFENVEIAHVDKREATLLLTIKGVKGELLSTTNMPEVEIRLNNEWMEIEGFEIEGNTLSFRVPSEVEINSIDTVRYAWRNDPKGYFYDSTTDLPLLPFRYSIEK